MKVLKSVLTAALMAALFLLGNHVAAWVREGAPKSVQGWIDTPWLDELVERVSSAPLAVSTVTIDLLIGATAALLAGALILAATVGKRPKRVGEEHGSARWGTRRDIAPFMDADPANRLILTHTENLSLDTHRTRRNLNVTVIGASGTGKTRGYMLPNIRAAQMSKVVTDPKGEIYRTTADAMIEQGYSVRSFNLVDMRNSGHFNPLQYFMPGDVEAGIMRLAEAIISNTDPGALHGGGGKDPFWERAERALLTALIGLAYSLPESEQPSLVDVLNLQKQMDGADGSYVDNLVAAARATVEEWKAGQRAVDESEVEDMQVLDFACRQYRTYEQGEQKTRQSVLISTGVRLAPLDMASVRTILSDDSMDLTGVGEEPTVVYVIVPDTHATFRFLAAMFWSTLFEVSLYQADHSPGGALPVPYHGFMDEIANIGKIPNFPALVAVIRSRGISVSMAYQSYSQGKALWDKEWDGILGNCDSILFLGGNELQTNKWLSESLGSATIQSDEISQSRGTSSSYSEAQRLLKRELMKPDEIGTMSNDLCILMLRGLPPFRSKKATLDLS